MLLEPALIQNVLSEADFSLLAAYLQRRPKEVMNYEAGRSRYLLNRDPVVRWAHFKLLDLARAHFGSATLVPSYSLYSRYEGPKANLAKHKDDNACTYTIDLCVAQNKPWSLFVESQEFSLEPNEAAVYYGNDQSHWREPLTDPASFVCMIFFHFVEPDHWYLTVGPQHVHTIRGDAPNGGMQAL